MPTPALALVLLLGLATTLWIVSLLLRDVSIVDIFWGPGFAVAAWFYTITLGSGFEALGGRRLLVPILVTVWALRLGLHIYLRNRGAGEDPRYGAMRDRHGPSFAWKSLFIVFWLQGFLVWVISMPLLAVASSRESLSLGPIDIVALAVFAVGLFFEAVGDWQLKRFKADPANRGRVLDSGLWRYTRHPNYFGDATLWWGYYLFAVAAGGAWTLFSPVLMSFLIVKVSGVALLEKSLGDTKPKYAEYIRKTPAFFPWIPKD